MITEDYVSFETAILLKEKGFDEENCYSYYGYSNIANPIKRPTQQMAMKWLREVYTLHIIPFIDNDEYCITIYNGNKYELISQYFSLDKYENAVEAALKYCLTNLI